MPDESLTPCECPEPGFCPRHQCEKPPHWHALCRTRADYFQLWENACGPAQNHASSGNGHVPHVVRRNPSVPRRTPRVGLSPTPLPTWAVIVISHNYGQFLAECLESVLAQTVVPTEVLVIDDSSTDETPDVARQFASRHVTYRRVSCRNVHQARRAGFEATSAEVLCFLDADDSLPPDYLAAGLPLFSDPAVGLVYSDVELFGESMPTTATATDARCSNYPAEFDRAYLERDNFLHAGSLVRREALYLSRAFEHSIDPLLTQGDWFLWRHVLGDGWTAVKQPAFYKYRQHGTNWTGLMRQIPNDYFSYAGLRHETVTLFIPLSGRSTLWPALAAYLDRQTWPHAQVRLVLMDTSQDPGFSRKVQKWIASCDYPDVRHVRAAVARAGVADDNRYQPQVRDQVRLAVARIYNRLAREVSTDYAWVIEDDILPPADACERLLRGFNRDTASVSGIYLSRYDGLPSVWGEDCRHLSSPADGLQFTYGNGFGCVVLRGGVLRSTVFRAQGDYDRVFYRQLHASGLKAKIDWRVVCEHRHVEAASCRSRPCTPTRSASEAIPTRSASEAVPATSASTVPNCNPPTPTRSASEGVPATSARMTLAEPQPPDISRPVEFVSTAPRIPNPCS